MLPVVSSKFSGLDTWLWSWPGWLLLSQPLVLSSEVLGLGWSFAASHALIRGTSTGNSTLAVGLRSAA